MFRTRISKGARIVPPVEALENRRLFSGYSIVKSDLSIPVDISDGGLSNNASIVGLRVGSPSGPEAVLRRADGTSQTITTRFGARPLDVNERGDVVGFYGDNDVSARRAFYWSNSTFKQLPGFANDGGAEAHALNNRGEIVGLARPRGGYSAAAIWRNGVPEFIGTLGGNSSTANDINDAGQVVGESSPQGNNLGHAFLYWHGEMTDLGTLANGTLSSALAINDSGWVTGASTTASSPTLKAFIYADGKMRGLGTLNGSSHSIGFGINDRGEVVGESGTGADLRAFVWTAQGGIVDLNSFFPGADFQLVRGINVNDRGQILAVGRPKSGPGSSLYLLTPDKLTEGANPATRPVPPTAPRQRAPESVLGRRSGSLLG
jgi:probable HAF family extracellular repeat protein